MNRLRTFLELSLEFQWSHLGARFNQPFEKLCPFLRLKTLTSITLLNQEASMKIDQRWNMLNWARCIFCCFAQPLSTFLKTVHIFQGLQYVTVLSYKETNSMIRYRDICNAVCYTENPLTPTHITLSYQHLASLNSPSCLKCTFILLKRKLNQTI